MSEPALSVSDPSARKRLSANVATLGFVSLLTAISSAMVYGLLPVFLVRVLGINVASVGLIAGMAESANSLIKIISGAVSDRTGRRKPLVIVGRLYTLCGRQDLVSSSRDSIDRAGRPRPRPAWQGHSRRPA